MGDCLQFEIEAGYVWRQNFRCLERQPSGYKENDGFASCCFATPVTDTHITMRPCIHPFVESAVGVIVTLVCEFHGPL